MPEVNTQHKPLLVFLFLLPSDDVSVPILVGAGFLRANGTRTVPVFLRVIRSTQNEVSVSTFACALSMAFQRSGDVGASSGTDGSFSPVRD